MRQLFMTVISVLFLDILTAEAQTIQNGSTWWDGERLYTAEVDEAGDVRMVGSRDVLIEPDEDCKWNPGDGPELRRQPIGPDVEY